MWNEVKSKWAASFRSYESFESSYGSTSKYTTEVSESSSSSVVGGIFNLANTILGSGMLGLPYAVASSGMAVAAVLYLLASSIGIFGLHLLSLCSQKERELLLTNNAPQNATESTSITIVTSKQLAEHETTYYSLSKATYPKVALIVDIALIIKCFGVSVSYLIVISTLMPAAMKGMVDNPLASSRLLWLGLSTLLCVPPSLLKKFDSLRYVSYVAIACVTYILILVVYYCFTLSPSHDIEGSMDDLRLFPRNFQDLFQNLPIFVFAFSGHQNIFSIQNGIKNPSKMPIIIITAPLIALNVYGLIGYCGYYTFRDNVKSNLILNLPDREIPVHICRMAVSILVAFSYPLQIYPCCISLQSPLSYLLPSRFLKYSHFTTITAICVCIITYIIAFFVEDLGIVLSLVGATGSVSLCYIFPGMFYYKITQFESGGRWTVKRVLALMMWTGGILLMVNSLTWIALG